MSQFGSYLEAIDIVRAFQDTVNEWHEQELLEKVIERLFDKWNQEMALFERTFVPEEERTR